MKVGDLVKIKDSVMYCAGYCIIVSLHWKGNTNLVTVVLNPDLIMLAFRKNDLEVINENWRYSKK